MKIKALTLFKRQHCNHVPTKGFTLAAWHWRWSLTWSWIFSWHPDTSYGPKAYYMRYSGYRNRGLYFCCGLRLPFIGHFSFTNQPTMKDRGYRP